MQTGSLKTSCTGGEKKIGERMGPAKAGVWMVGGKVQTNLQRGVERNSFLKGGAMGRTEMGGQLQNRNPTLNLIDGKREGKTKSEWGEPPNPTPTPKRELGGRFPIEVPWVSKKPW